MASSGSIRAGSAFVEIGVNDSALRAGLDAAQARVQAFGQGIATVGASMAALGALVTAPLVAAAKVWAEGGAEMLHLSQRTGIAVEALGRLKFVAEQAGAGIGDIELALKKMGQVIAKADDDGKAASATLASIGIEVDDLLGLSPDEQFLKIGDAISRIGEESKRTAAAVAAFGRGGKALAPIFAEGAGHIQEQFAEFERLGLSGTSLANVKAADDLSKAFGALWSQMKRITSLLGGVLGPGMTDMVKIAQNVLALVIDWIKHNKDLIATVARVAFVVTGVGTALYVLGTALSLVNVLAIADTVAWVAWQAVVLAANVVVTLFNAQMAAWSALLSVGATVSAIWSAGVVVATGVTWLWNAALAVLSAELIVPLIAATLAAAGTVVILGAALVAATATVWAAFQAGTALFQVLSTMPTTSGPLAAVGAVIGEWIGILNDVYKAATIRLPLAWSLLQAGATLAVSQVRDLWPPLWTFIQAGFTAVWTAVSEIFVVSFQQAISKIFTEFVKFGAILGPLLGINVQEVEKAQQEMDKATVQARKLAIEKAKRDLAEATKKFGVEESPETKKAREELKKRQDELAKLVGEQKPGALPGGEEIDTGTRKFAQVGTFSAAAAVGGALAGNALLANILEAEKEQKRIAEEQLKALEEVAKILAGGNPLGIPIF